MSDQKPRQCETEKLVSLHVNFAPVGTVKYATPEEAKLLIDIGVARRFEEQPTRAGYLHREMLAAQPVPTARPLLKRRIRK